MAARFVCCVNNPRISKAQDFAFEECILIFMKLFLHQILLLKMLLSATLLSEKSKAEEVIKCLAWKSFTGIDNLFISLVVYCDSNTT